MARLTLRLMLTAIVFGVALGILYSLALGFRRPQQLALPHLRNAKGLGMRLRHHHRRHRHAHQGRAKAGDSAQAAAAAGTAAEGAAGAGAAATVAGEVGEKPLQVQAEAQQQQQQQQHQPSLGSQAEGEASSSAPQDPIAGGIASVTAAAADAGVSDGASGSAMGKGEEAATAATETGAGTGAAAEEGQGPVDPSVPLPRVCGSPAVDGYAHVDPKCLVKSPTNRLWWQQNPGGGKSGEGLECNVEHAVSLDGLAVGWGIGNKKDTPEECCQACRDHRPGPHIGGPFGNLPCNVWVWCSEEVCYEADAHHHTKGDCWLKFSEAPQSPEVNARGDFTDAFKQRHPDAPKRCQWVSGVLVPPGQKHTNGTWGPRFDW